MNTALDVRDLTVLRQSPTGSIALLDRVTFAINCGESLCIIGESGSGKTTAALATVGLLPDDLEIRGTVLIHGNPATGFTDGHMRRFRGREVAMVFQDPAASLNPVYMLGDQIAEIVRWHEKVSRNAASARSIALLSEVGLPEPSRVARAYPHQLSGGMRQRALIAAALASNPSILIADEPTASLDPTMRGHIVSLLGMLKEVRRLTLLVVTHDLSVVAGVADRVAVMQAGHIVEQADVRTLLTCPSHPHTRHLLRSAAQLSVGSTAARCDAQGDAP